MNIRKPTLLSAQEVEVVADLVLELNDKINVMLGYGYVMSDEEVQVTQRRFAALRKLAQLVDEQVVVVLEMKRAIGLLRARTEWLKGKNMSLEKRLQEVETWHTKERAQSNAVGCIGLAIDRRSEVPQIAPVSVLEVDATCVKSTA